MKATLEYLLFLTIARILQLLPLGAVRMLAKSMAAFVYYVLPVRKKLTLQQLRRAFPEMDDGDIRDIAFGSYINLITTIFELMWTPRLTLENLPQIIHIKNPEVVVNARRRGSGLIMMSGHFGNWEWLSIGASRLMEFTATAIVHPLHNSSVNALVESWRTQFGNRMVDLGLSVREIITTIRGRGIVAMIADQSGPSGSLYVRLFGRYAATYEGPATFALRTGAPVVMTYAVRRDDGNYDILVEEIPTQDLHGLTDENLHELTRRHVRALERMVTKHPDQWLWQHKRWKHTPHEESVLIEDAEDA